MAGYICKIVIEDTHPPVWRRVVIPDKITFQEFHEIIQVLFGWEDMHLHGFEIPADHIIIDDEGESFFAHYNETETRIDPFFKNYKWIRYTYDFGDNWRHRINIEKTDDAYTERYATLTKSRGDNFQEDSGGLWKTTEDDRNIFDKEEITEQLKQRIFPTHDELEEPKLLKESMEELEELSRKLDVMTPEEYDSVIAETLQDEEDKPSPLDERIGGWRSYAEHRRKKVSLKIEQSSKTQQDLLLDIGEEDVAAYYRYLRLPQVKGMTGVEKIKAVSDILKTHPEYLLYVFNKEEYKELSVWTSRVPGVLKKKISNENMPVKLLALGLGEFDKEEEKLCLAKDIDQYIDVIDEEIRRGTFEKLEKFDFRLGCLIRLYGMIEFDSLFQTYKEVYQEEIDKDTFFRYIYWHEQINGMIDVAYQSDGICYVVERRLDPFEIIEQIENYSEFLPYMEYDEEEIETLGESMTDRNEWTDILYDWFRCVLKMRPQIAQSTLLEIVVVIMNGWTLDEIMMMLESQHRQIAGGSKAVEIWMLISGLMLELQLPMLKGRSRLQYAEEQGISPWSVGMLTDSVKTENTKKKHLYQFSEKVQEWMYELAVGQPGDAMEKLLDYKEKNQICSEEYIYYVANAAIIRGEQEKTVKKLIQELRESSWEGKKRAKELEEQIEMQMEDEDLSWSDDTWNWWGENEIQQPYVRDTPKVGRNDPCPCGSGKKYKKCCGKN